MGAKVFGWGLLGEEQAGDGMGRLSEKVCVMDKRTWQGAVSKRVCVCV